MAGVAGYTWVAVLHLWWGFSFRTTLMLANITSVAWLFVYHAVLPSRKLEAASQLHTLTSRSSSVTGLPHDQIDASNGFEAAVDRSPGTQEQQGNSSQIAEAESNMVQPPSSQSPTISSLLLVLRFSIFAPSYPLYMPWPINPSAALIPFLPLWQMLGLGQYWVLEVSALAQAIRSMCLKNKLLTCSPSMSQDCPMAGMVGGFSAVSNLATH